jgi:predicted acyltransferase
MIGDLPKSVALPSGDDRLVSLDALRGFDMFWIIGGVPILNEAAKLTGWLWLNGLSAQMHHTDWDGFTLYDLIFPLFLFIAGVAMPLSFEKRLERGDSKVSLYQHVIIRGLMLVLFGMIYNGLLKFDWAHTRLPSVLGRIGLAYLFAGLIVLSAGVRAQIAWTVALLGAYWAAMKFIPVPGFGAGDLAPGHNLADYIDSQLIPGVLLHNNLSRDPEGILSTVPAIGTALAGALTGQLLKNKRYDGYIKTVAMVVAALGCLGLALLWNRDFPINKNLWSSSFVLYCAGWSLLLLAFFYLVTDVWRFRAWTLPLVVIGSNSILIYMAQKFIKFEYTSDFFFGGLLKYIAESPYAAAYQPLLLAISILTIKWLMLYVLYRKRVFLRV